LLNCAAQLLMRKGMMVTGELGFGNFIDNIVPMITNVWLWGMVLCYAMSIVLWLIVLSRVEVSFAYPFLSVGYVVAAIAEFYLFSAPLSANRIAGIVIICIGVFFISRS
nr:4-amino-4-deoxy-L-arabinose transferase [Muribaculaceae bacterium]